MFETNPGTHTLAGGMTAAVLLTLLVSTGATAEASQGAPAAGATRSSAPIVSVRRQAPPRPRPAPAPAPAPAPLEAPEPPAEAPEPPEPPDPDFAFDFDEAELEAAIRTAAEAFAKARSSMDQGDLERAADLFRRAYEMDPKFAQADAALYWRAWSTFKSEDLDQAREAIEHLAREFPKSQWLDDAKALEIELAARRAAIDELEKEYEETPDCEIKKAALTGIFNSKPERAVDLAIQVLGPNSTLCPEGRRHALRILGMSGLPRARAALLNIAKIDTSVRMRRDALMSLAHGRAIDDATFAALRDIVMTEKQPELVRAALFSIARRNDPRAKQLILDLVRTSSDPEVRRLAVQSLVHREYGVTYDELVSLYDSVSDVGVRRTLVMIFRESNDPRAFDKLVRIATSQNESLDVRRHAMLYIGESRDKEKAALALIKIFDDSTDKGMRRHALLSLRETRSKTALRKLIQVAKGDPDIELRKHAVIMISESKDPEAVQFLEELVK